jgi:hypothetical protein
MMNFAGLAARGGPVFASAKATVRSGVRGLGRQIQLISGHESKRSLEVY